MASSMMRIALLAATAIVNADLSSQALLPRGYANYSFGPLQFNEDGTFQISILEDLHFGESRWPSSPWAFFLNQTNM